MPTPSIQTLRADAQQVLNLDSISAVRSVVAATLANANAGTPLNPNLTTQQLWNEFYQIVTQPKSDIESIIANQLMKFMYAPPAPGGVGADKQVIFNDGGVLAGDPGLTFDKVTNALTITGDLAVRTNKLYVTATGVGCGMTPITPLSVSGAGGIILFRTTDPSAPVASPYLIAPVSTGFSSTSPVYGYWYQSSGIGNPAVDAVSVITASNERYRIAADGIATWSNVGGVAGTAMTLNSTGLGIGAAPELKLRVDGPDAAPATSGSSNTNGAFRIGAVGASTNLCVDAGVYTTGGVYGWFQARSRGNYALNYDLVFNPNGGNVGIGVTPSATAGKLQVFGTGDQTDENATLMVGSSSTNGMRLYTGVNNTNEYCYIGSVKSGVGYRTLKLQPNGGNAIICLSITPPTLSVGGDMVFNLTSNTNLRISVRGTDGTTRVANITLA